MAHVSLHVDGDVDISKMDAEDECLCLTLESYLDEKREDIYQRDHVSLHGSPAQIRAFAEGILAKVPKGGN